MSSRSSSDPRQQASSRPPARRRVSSRRSDDGPRGPHIGRMRITPVRVFLLVALVGGIGFLVYSVLVRDQLQVPLMATGFAVCGIVFAVAAMIAVTGVVRAGRNGHDGTAVATALLGGMMAIASMLCLAAAVIFSMIWSGTSGS